jgi:hypothetical protein
LIGFEESANCILSPDGRRQECSLQALSRRLIGKWQNQLVVVDKTLILQTIPSLSQESCICPHPDSFMYGHPPPARENITFHLNFVTWVCQILISESDDGWK